LPSNNAPPAMPPPPLPPSYDQDQHTQPAAVQQQVSQVLCEIYIFMVFYQ